MDTRTHLESTRERSGPRRSLSPRGSGGQIIVFYMVFIIPMAFLMFSIYNVGQLVSEKMKLQNAADNAAYSAAVWEARYMNLNAYIGRAMVADYDTMAMLLSLWSVADSWDGFIGIVSFVSQFIPYVGPEIHAVLKPVHQGLHEVNAALAKGLGGGKKGQAFLYVMEMYNMGLSAAQEAIYFLNQAGRISVIESIAWGVDPKIRYLGFSEFLNAVSLNSRVKWDKLNSANGFTEEKALRQTITRSLNEVSRGENFRDAGSSLLAPVNAILIPFDALCKLITLGSGSVGLSIGPLGYDVKDFDEITGQIGGPGECTDGCDQDQVVQNDKLYEHDFAGISLDVCVVSVKVGHHSDDAWNLPLGVSKIASGDLGIAPPHIVDDVEDTGDDHGAFQDVKNFTDNGIDCSSVGADLGSLMSGGGAADSCRNSSNDTCGFQNPLTGPLLTDKLENGEITTADYRAACEQSLCSNVPEGQTCDQQVPDLGDRLDAADTCGQLLSPGGQNQAGNTNFSGQSGGNAGSGPCQTVYMFATPLNEVSMTWFVRDSEIDAALDGRRIQGPTVFVYFEKAAENLPLFVGSNIFGSPKTLGAYSFAKVYYTRKAGDTAASPGSGSKRTEGKETLFNPFWAARLELPKLPVPLPNPLFH